MVILTSLFEKKRISAVFFLCALISFPAWPDEIPGDEGEESSEEEMLVLPAVSLKYSQLYYLQSGFWKSKTEVTAPLLHAEDGMLYGISSRSIGSRGGVVFRLDPEGSSQFYPNEDGGQIIHEFEYDNLLASNLVQVANGDIFGMAKVLERGDRDDEGNWPYYGPGLVVFKLPASDPMNLQVLDIVDEADLPALDRKDSLGSGIYGNLIVNPQDGHIYGVAYTSAAGGGGPVVFRIHSDGSALDIVYRFGLADEAGNRILYTPLSITSEANGQLAVMMAGAVEKDYGAEADLPTGVLFRLNPANVPSEGALEPIHVFTVNEIPRFTASSFLNPPVLGNGYLVDAGNGWWYGTSGGLLRRHTIYNTTGADDGGRIFRIRHDGSGFEVLHEFSNSCPEGVAPYNVSDRYLGLTPEEYAALTRPGRLELEHQQLFANDDCYRDWPDGKTPAGPLVMADDGLIYGTAMLGGMNFWKDEDVRPEDSDDPNQYNYSTTTLGTVFRLFPEYAEEDGGGFQLVRPFRKPIGENFEAGIPQGLTVGRDGKLYGVSQGTATALNFSGEGQPNSIYSFEFDAANIDITSTATANMLPGDEFTISWWAYQVTQCQAYSRSLPEWNGDLQVNGSKTLIASQAGNHRLEIFCQNDDGTVYMENAFSVPVYSPPLTEEQYLELFNYKHDSAGSFDAASVFAMLSLLGWRYRKYLLGVLANS